jgi:hypothetical protein
MQRYRKLVAHSGHEAGGYKGGMYAAVVIFLTSKFSQAPRKDVYNTENSTCCALLGLSIGAISIWRKPRHDEC